MPASNQKNQRISNTNKLDYIFFTPMDDIEIQQIINSLQNSHGKGHDDHSMNTIKKTVAINYQNLSVLCRMA